MLSKIIPLVVVLIALTIGAEQLLNRPKPPEQNKPVKQDAAVAEAAVASLLPADSVSEELKAPDKEAETVSADQPAQILPINDTQTRAEVIPGPPAGFDPLTASPADLERYGIPPRPDPKTDPTGFAVWQQMIANVKERVTGEVQQTNRFHGPVQLAGPVEGKNTGIANAINLYSINWAGEVISSYTNSFFPPNWVHAYWVVPEAKHAFGHPNLTADFASEWVGFDGFTSPDVFQAGTDTIANFVNGVDTGFYNFWFEWYPFPAVAIPFLPVKAGDIAFVQVWNSSPLVGYAWLQNVSTGAAAAFKVSAPGPAYALHGTSAEWVIERPDLLVNGKVTQPWLTNYIGTAFSACDAVGLNHLWQPGGLLPLPLRLYNITERVSFTDTRVISQGFLTDPDSLWFWAEGPVRAQQ